jgi:hypothetical protein
MALNLVKTVADFLRQRSEEKFKARHMAQWIFETFPAECHEKKSKSTFIKTDEQLIQQLVAEIGSQRPNIQKNHPKIKTTEGRPREYYWTEKSEQTEVLDAEKTEETVASPSILLPSLTIAAPLKEADLYPMLATYLWSDHAVRLKRIDERRSRNKEGPNGNKWLYPDLVGMEDLTSNLHEEIKQIITVYGIERQGCGPLK